MKLVTTNRKKNMFSLDKSFIRSTAKSTVHLQINLGLQQLQLLKFNIKFSQVYNTENRF